MIVITHPDRNGFCLKVTSGNPKVVNLTWKSRVEGGELVFSPDVDLNHHKVEISDENRDFLFHKLRLKEKRVRLPEKVVEDPRFVPTDHLVAFYQGHYENCPLVFESEVPRRKEVMDREIINLSGHHLTVQGKECPSVGVAWVKQTIEDGKCRFEIVNLPQEESGDVAYILRERVALYALLSGRRDILAVLDTGKVFEIAENKERRPL